MGGHCSAIEPRKHRTSLHTSAHTDLVSMPGTRVCRGHQLFSSEWLGGTCHEGFPLVEQREVEVQKMHAFGSYCEGRDLMPRVVGDIIHGNVSGSETPQVRNGWRH